MHRLFAKGRVRISYAVIIVMVFMTMSAVTSAQQNTLNVTLGVERVNASTLQLTAQSTGGTGVEYQFDFRMMGSGDQYITLKDYSPDSEFTWHGANEGELYEMVVHAQSEDESYSGYYVVFANVNPSLEPQPFNNVTLAVTRQDNNDFTLEAAAEGGSNVIYKFEYSDDEGQSYQDVRGYDAYSPVSSFTWSGAEEGKDYYFVVHAVDITTPDYEYQSEFVAYCQEEPEDEAVHVSTEPAGFPGELDAWNCSGLEGKWEVKHWQEVPPVSAILFARYSFIMPPPPDSGPWESLPVEFTMNDMVHVEGSIVDLEFIYEDVIISIIESDDFPTLMDVRGTTTSNITITTPYATATESETWSWVVDVPFPVVSGHHPKYCDCN